MANLNSFLKLIDPDNTIYETEQRTSEAINSFNAGSGSVSDINDFQDLLGRFYWHVDSNILGIGGKSNPNREFTRGLALNVINELYGNRGLKTAYEMASAGVEGGLYRVLKDFAEQRAEYYINNGISTRVYEFLKNMSFDEKLDVAREYKRRFGHILPAEIMKSSDAYLVSILHRVLESHPDLISRMRKLDR